MYPSSNDVSWRGSFIKEQVDSLRFMYPELDIDVFHIRGSISGGSNYNYLRRLPHLLFKIFFGGYDIIHCHHSFCALLCLPRAWKYIYTVHEGEINEGGWRSWAIKTAIFFSKSAVYVSRSEYSRSKHRKKHFLPCGVNFDLFRPAPDLDRLRQRFGLSLNDQVILFPADPNRPEKNAFLLRDAEKLARSRSQHWTVVYGGKIPKELMPMWMAASDVVVSVGRFESDGMVIKEALATNTPVVSTDVGNSREYIGATNGLIVPGTAEGVYEGISTILADIDRYRNGRDQLRLLGIDMNSTAAKLFSIYYSCTRS